ncbi:DUF2291 domain-containing protein [Segetibacter sp. 3557_3]|uniref:DUF2291 domain-containing protein n=1 Tax=Segetibacter sp. 3557_3 TaxID=2547429 RepID=UPI001058C387|nr:DUF2291 domain-containing protein [Segetibacter sp. 3557_3]TDH27465.1 DUF2291 domain-containing protein [Segetibacter sp. 3557_3]
MKKTLKYILGLAALVFVAYNSVYFKKLDAVRASAHKQFDASAYARKYYDTRLKPALKNAVEINQLLALARVDKEAAFNRHSHALGIGNIRYFLVQGTGEITGINENDVAVISKNDSTQSALKIATEFVFGNAIRDASGLINLNEFSSTADFNNVSAEVNKIVRNEVLPAFKSTAKKGDRVHFVGAIELNRQHLKLDDLEIIPVALNLIKDK